MQLPKCSGIVYPMLVKSKYNITNYKLEKMFLIYITGHCNCDYMTFRPRFFSDFLYWSFVMWQFLLKFVKFDDVFLNRTFDSRLYRRN